jgi:hypothetical protein
MRHVAAFALLFLLSAPARAERVEAEYAVYALGIQVMEVRAYFDTNERGYAMQFNSRLRGPPSVVLGEARQATTVTGMWTASGVQPIRYDASGVWRGDPRRTTVEWNGPQPAIRALVPPNEAEREEVPAAQQRGTIDSLSAIVLLARQVQREGRCEASGNLYDGRRLTTISARTEGSEAVPASRGEWSGRALRCAFEGRLIGGFRREDNGPDARRPTTGTAWIAEVVPGAPPLPVRIETQTRMLGTLSAHLVSARLAPAQASAR